MAEQLLFEPTLEEIHFKLANLRLDRIKRKFKILLLFIPIFIILLIIYILSFHYERGDAVLLILAYIGFLIVNIYIIYRQWDKLAALNIELSLLEEQGKKIASDPTASSVTKGFFKELVGFNIEYLRAYNALIKNHTQKSFFVSIVSGIFGFGLIMVGICLGFLDKNNLTNNLTYIAAVSGIIIEFISGIFFYLYNRTVRELKEYHNSLLDVQNVLLSFNIVQDLEGEAKAEMLSQVISSLSSRGGPFTSKRTTAGSNVSNNQPVQE